jgi:exonuclease VII small subunit
MLGNDYCDCDYCREKTRSKSGRFPCDCELCKPKSCQENLDELMSSVVNIENALAKAIETECEIFKNGNLTSQELNHFINKLEQLLKMAIQKEIMLDFLIEDAIKTCKKN